MSLNPRSPGWMVVLLAAAAGFLAPLTRAQDVPRGPTGTAAIEGDRTRVTLNLRQAPLGDVLRQLAELYELNLIAPKDIAGTVTMRFKDVPIEEALESIVRTSGYAIIRRGSIIEVVPPSAVPLTASERGARALAVTGTALPEAIQESEIKLFPVRHARGEDIVKFIEPLLTPKIGYVAYDPSRTTLLVRDLPENLLKIAAVIDKLDTPSPETAIKALAQQPATIKVVRLRYVETASIRKVLETIAKAEQVEMEEEPSTKSIILRGYPERIAAVERMVQTLDQKTQQVRIKVRIVETTLGNEEKLGIDWNVRLSASGSSRPWSFPFPAHTPEKWVFYPTPNPISTAGGGGTSGTTGTQQLAGYAPGDSMPQILSNQVTFGILDTTQFSALLEAIASDTNSNLVASPELTTLDNKKAKISLGQIVPIPIYTNIVSTQTQTVFPTITGFDEIETGTILTVTPRVGADEYVTLEVTPEISEITGFVGPNQERPIRSQRRMETTVVLRSGATLALGGLNQSKTTETVTKVPFLGDIPLLGRLFSHKTETVSKTDLLIFITPELVREERVAEKPAEKEARERGLVKVGERWVSASELDAVNRAGKRLRSESSQVRRDAIAEIAGLAEAERSELLERAQVLANVLRADSDIEVKRAAAEALGAVDPARLATELSTLPGAAPIQAVGEVLVPMALRMPSRSTRQIVLANAAKVDRASTVTALMAAVAFGKPFEQLVGVEGLALAGDPSAASVLEDALRGRQPALAEAAADALGACGGPQAVGALLAALGSRPPPHLGFHLAAALAEAVGDDAGVAKELSERGLMLSPRTRELLQFEHRERRGRFDRVLKSYATVAAAEGPKVNGPPEAVARVSDALKLLAEGSPGHRHLVTVALEGIEVIPAPTAPAGASPAPRAVARLERGWLKIPAADVQETPAIHLAHELVYHAALSDVLAPPADLAGGAERPAAGAPGPVGHRAEETALREQYFAIQALAGRTDFRDLDGSAPSIEEALEARGLSTDVRTHGR